VCMFRNSHEIEPRPSDCYVRVNIDSNRTPGQVNRRVESRTTIGNNLFSQSPVLAVVPEI
jgi:hypothetical protein